MIHNFNFAGENVQIDLDVMNGNYLHRKWCSTETRYVDTTNRVEGQAIKAKLFFSFFPKKKTPPKGSAYQKSEALLTTNKVMPSESRGKANHAVASARRRRRAKAKKMVGEASRRILPGASTSG
jgi:hypothetical protein